MRLKRDVIDLLSSRIQKLVASINNDTKHKALSLEEIVEFSVTEIGVKILILLNQPLIIPLLCF